MSLCVSACVGLVSASGQSGEGLHVRDSVSQSVPSSSSVTLQVFLSLPEHKSQHSLSGGQKGAQRRKAEIAGLTEHAALLPLMRNLGSAPVAP